MGRSTSCDRGDIPREPARRRIACPKALGESGPENASQKTPRDLDIFFQNQKIYEGLRDLLTSFVQKASFKWKETQKT